MLRLRARSVVGATLLALLAAPGDPAWPAAHVSAGTIGPAIRFAGRAITPAGRARVDAAPAARTPVIAVAIRGDIYALPIDGAAARRLTVGGLADSPLLSPDGRRIAYLSVPRGAAASANPTAHDVWIVPVDGRPDGSSAVKLTASSAGVDRGALAWSPDGRRLAYASGASIVVSDLAPGRARAVLRLGAPFSTISPPGPIAWSPDGRRLAVALPLDDPIGSYPRTLRVAIADLAGGRDTTVTIAFARGALGRGLPPGSYPSGDGLAWSPDERAFIVATLAEGEGPPRPTGLWRVPASGGQAKLFVGTAEGVRRETYPPGTPLSNASHVIWSPDGRHLALDPASGFWWATADGLHGRFINLSLASDCQVAQYTWLTGASGLAYVTICGHGPVAPIREQLFALPFGAAGPRLLYALSDPNTGRPWLDLASAYRSIGGGY